MFLAGVAPARAAPVYVTFLSTTTTACSGNLSGQFAGAPDFPSSARHTALWNDPAVPTNFGALGDIGHANMIGNNDIVAGYPAQMPVDACNKQGDQGDCRTGLPTPAPEPAALVLLLIGLLAIGAGRHGPQRSLVFS